MDYTTEQNSLIASALQRALVARLDSPLMVHQQQDDVWHFQARRETAVLFMQGCSELKRRPQPQSQKQWEWWEGKSGSTARL